MKIRTIRNQKAKEVLNIIKGRIRRRESYGTPKEPLVVFKVVIASSG
ncbi:hypothetical protein HN014_10555 [Aquimarina sp. TRL1]|nr:hypothetical protein [Aquimarina sp. TRL1]QKX05337.1 hypothetical protein HN014_10555 [Aquimarina sp. TRL1]